MEFGFYPPPSATGSCSRVLPPVSATTGFATGFAIRPCQRRLPPASATSSGRRVLTSALSTDFVTTAFCLRVLPPLFLATNFCTGFCHQFWPTRCFWRNEDRVALIISAACFHLLVTWSRVCIVTFVFSVVVAMVPDHGSGVRDPH